MGTAGVFDELAAARGLALACGAIFFGGVAGPVALTYGLVTSAASTASLLLNLEAVFCGAAGVVSVPGVLSLALAVGFLGYGVSLVLFVLALRRLGTARAGAYFSVAPFFGALLAVLLQGDAVTSQLIAAGLLMAAGVWLHLTEHHGHLHAHQQQKHTHAHSHDEHHRHSHDFAWDGREPHTHSHIHMPLVHAHAHYPDVHHRHPH